ncbi:toll/interleukin-1 receptor domain-containing protein [Syntrophus aciditrophicus]|nr:toll/interleukin-1 receptor domain-containing protein [Syntrophus aciditrophicus]
MDSVKEIIVNIEKILEQKGYGADRQLEEAISQINVRLRDLNAFSGTQPLSLRRAEYEKDIENRCDIFLSVVKESAQNLNAQQRRDLFPALNDLARRWLGQRINAHQKELDALAARLGVHGPKIQDSICNRVFAYIDAELQRFSEISKTPTVKFSTTLGDGTTKTIELPAPSSMKAIRFVTLLPGDIATEQDLVETTLKMFNGPEVEVGYYTEYQQPIDKPLEEAIKRGDILVLKEENYYYKHSRHERVFIQISPLIPGSEDIPEWKKELEKTTPFVKRTISLSERKKRELEIYQKIEMEEFIREQRKVAKNSYEVFLSYSEKDSSIANTIRDELQQEDARVFMAQKSLEPGDDFAEKIKLALRGSAEVWVIMSPNSLNSEWVATEWGAAWILDKKIIPILHRCDVSQIPERLRRFHCVDTLNVGAMIKERFTAAKD